MCHSFEVVWHTWDGIGRLWLTGFWLLVLGRGQVVCAPGSVDVEEAKKIIRQKRVQHLYSRINGRLSSKFGEVCRPRTPVGDPSTSFAYDCSSMCTPEPCSKFAYPLQKHYTAPLLSAWGVQAFPWPTSAFTPRG